MDIWLQEEPAEERSQQRPGGVTSPGVSEEQGAGKQCGWSGLRTGVEASLESQLGQVVDQGKNLRLYFE